MKVHLRIANGSYIFERTVRALNTSSAFLNYLNSREAANCRDRLVLINAKMEGGIATTPNASYGYKPMAHSKN